MSVDATSDELRARVAALEAEVKEQQELAAAFEEELQATVAERDSERATSTAALAERDAALKKAQLEANDALADLGEATEARRVAEAAHAESKAKARAVEQELERLIALERQRAFDLRKATAEADKALEDALILQTTNEELRARLRRAEGDLMHSREEADGARLLMQQQRGDPHGNDHAAAADGPVVDGAASRSVSNAASSCGSSVDGGALTTDMREVLARLREVALECRRSRVAAGLNLVGLNNKAHHHHRRASRNATSTD